MPDTNVQVTLLQLDNYGPWTVTPEPRRESDLQSLQASLFADVSRAFGAHDGYVFFTRFDNMVAVTNGADASAHARVQETVRNRYPVTVSLSVAADASPADALAAATRRLQTAGSAQDEARTEVLAGDPIPAGRRTPEDVRIAHFDVDDVTGRYTDRLDAYDSHLTVERVRVELMEYLRERHGSLAFFVGGDNVIAVVPGLADRAYDDAIDHVHAETGVDLKVGVGVGSTAHEAGHGAKHALEECRADGTRLERNADAAYGD
jgi:GTP cyclohydrolase IIa